MADIAYFEDLMIEEDEKPKYDPRRLADTTWFFQSDTRTKAKFAPTKVQDGYVFDVMDNCIGNTPEEMEAARRAFNAITPDVRNTVAVSNIETQYQKEIKALTERSQRLLQETKARLEREMAALQKESLAAEVPEFDLPDDVEIDLGPIEFTESELAAFRIKGPKKAKGKKK